MRMKFEVIVQVKAEVLDPEARAITETLHRLGMPQVKKVEVAKRYVLEIEQTHTATTQAQVESQVDSIAREYLANSVSETYQVRRM